ncbi:hypothetical protein [Aureibacter tunicatorum]|uniref:FAS1 domain-containing protein n=1 Tax=Aureibacter tunicatorum TaxID=866807 RepID=A0AAE3XKC6_9BACT|nr:hypothetical protein [Aureibacter tunicatorum]MDR6238115.1 hypothetical protein [Aureibacter tunicatorum]BDD03148.1 hypothetical protein AUTU_06310 [Aureibacter tunicatorum]
MMKFSTKRNWLYLLTGIIVFFSACNNSDDNSAPETVSQQVLSQYGDSKFGQLYKKSKYYTEFDKKLPYRVDVFVPSDEALKETFTDDEYNNFDQEDIDRIVGINLIKNDDNDDNFSKKLYNTVADNSYGNPIKAHISKKDGQLYIDGVKADFYKEEPFGKIYRTQKFHSSSNILNILKSDPDYYEFYKLLVRVKDLDSKLDDLLNNLGKPFSIFPVSNQGIERYLKLKDYNSVEDIPVEEAKKIVGRHIGYGHILPQKDKPEYFTNYNNEKGKAVIGSNGKVKIYTQDPSEANNTPNENPVATISELVKKLTEGLTEGLTEDIGDVVGDFFEDL